MENLRYRLIFDPVKTPNSRKEPFKNSKIKKFGYIALQFFSTIVLRAEIVITFGSKMVTVSTRNTKI